MSPEVGINKKSSSYSSFLLNKHFEAPFLRARDFREINHEAKKYQITQTRM
jgi:hypothetical protein